MKRKRRRKSTGGWIMAFLNVDRTSSGYLTRKLLARKLKRVWKVLKIQQTSSAIMKIFEAKSPFKKSNSIEQHEESMFSPFLMFDFTTCFGFSMIFPKMCGTNGQSSSKIIFTKCQEKSKKIFFLLELQFYPKRFLFLP